MVPFDVNWSPETRTMMVLMKGFWSDDAVSAFEVELCHALRKAGGQPFDLVADLSDLLAQSSAVVILQAGVIARLSEAGMRHLVIVGAAALLTMQVRRAAAPLVPHFVGTSNEAREWLNANPD